jgi:hypothetical protein
MEIVLEWKTFRKWETDLNDWLGVLARVLVVGAKVDRKTIRVRFDQTEGPGEDPAKLVHRPRAGCLD